MMDNPVKRTRTLRARDVIPPFDKCVESPEAESCVGPPVPPPSGNEGGSEGYFTPGVSDVAPASLAPDAAEIPAYDLAENILAEQRRAAGRRRRGPGRPVETQDLASPPSSRGSGARLSAPDLATQDLLELQRVVAEIVAKDIARLCHRPERPVLVRS
jgi:hypothetical protein